MMITLTGCAMEIDGGDDELEESYAAAKSVVIADNVYIRWAPGSSTIDYFMKGDRVNVHGTTGDRVWRCVSGTTRYGLPHTGWVIASAVHRADSDGDDGDRGDECKYGLDELDDFEVTFTNCRILGRGAFRYGPFSHADRIGGDRTVDGFLDPAQGRTCLARASDSQGGVRAAEGDYIWTAWRPDFDPVSNKAPGKTGWFRRDLLDCSAAVSCADDDSALVFEEEPDPEIAAEEAATPAR